MKFLFSTLLLLILSSSLYTQSGWTVNLSGKTYRPLDTLVLLKPYENLKYEGQKIAVSSDSTFSFDLKEANTEEYNLVFLSEFRKSLWREIVFFTDADSLHFSLYPKEEFELNQITGSDLTLRSEAHYQRTISLFEDDFKRLFQQRKEYPVDSPEASVIRAKIDSLNKVLIIWELDELSKEPDPFGLSKYFDILEASDNYGLTKAELAPFHNLWKDKFPENSLTSVVNNLYHSLAEVETSDTLRDFDLLTETTMEGRLSDAIREAEYTLLTLWSPWCAPCLKKDKKLAENYLSLSKKGLNVVSVIGGITDLEAYSLNKAKRQYPWEVYREIDEEQEIWQKYGLSNSGGSWFLLDNNGNIVVRHATIEEVTAIIEK